MNACVHTDTKPQISSTQSRGLGWRIHGSVEDTNLSTNKQHSLSLSSSANCEFLCFYGWSQDFTHRLTLLTNSPTEKLTTSSCRTDPPATWRMWRLAGEHMVVVESCSISHFMTLYMVVTRMIDEKRIIIQRGTSRWKGRVCWERVCSI